MLRTFATILAAMLIPSLLLGQSTAPIWAMGEAGTKLLNIDTTTGAATVVGSTGIAGTAPLAFHPDGTLYTFTQVMTSNIAIPEQLAVLDLATGHATLIGSPLAERTRIMPLIVSPDGTLYGAGLMGSSANKLLIIDRTTGQSTVVGPFGVSNMMDLTYGADGTLYGANQTALYRINTATGAATLIVPFSGDVVFGGTSRVMGIHFAPDGTLYATDYVSAALGNSSLYTVDPATGATHRIGNTGVFSVHSAEMRPPSAAARVAGLITEVEEYGLPFGIERSFTAKLESAAALIEQGSPLGACGALQDFHSEVAALSGKKVTKQQAAQLQLDATWTDTSLNCPK